MATWALGRIASRRRVSDFEAYGAPTMTRGIVISVVVLATVLTATACDESDPNASEDPSTSGEVLHLDPVGTTSVASHESETVVVVGRDSDEPEYLFDRIRDGILTDHGFWIADGGSNEIRYYSPDGAFQYALGGLGDGPGEFRSLMRIFLLEPASLLAFDAGGRVTEFGPEKQVVRTFDAPWFEDGLRATEYVRVGAREFAALVRAPRDPREHIGETQRDTVELILMDASGGGYRSTGIRLPDRWWTFGRTAAGFGAESPPDGPSALLATLGPNLVTSTSESLELRVWAADALGAVAPSSVAVEREQGQTGGVTPRAIDQLVASDDGGLWIGLHPADEDAVKRWIWIDGDSQIAARLDLPRSYWLLDARGGQLLVRAADSMGNQIVQLLAVR